MVVFAGHAVAVGTAASDAESLALQLKLQEFSSTRILTLSIETFLALLSNGGDQPEAVFLRELANPASTIEQLERIRRATTAPIALVVHSRTSPPLIDYVRAGATDCIADGEHVNRELHQFTERTRRNARGNQTPGRRVSVLPSAGGCGASTVAVNLAASLAEREHTSCLIDLHCGGGSLALMLDLQPANSLIDLCEYASDIDSELLSNSLCQHPCGFHLLASSLSAELKPRPDASTVSRIVSLTHDLFEHTILDFPGVVEASEHEAFLSSDLIILVMRLDLPCIVRTKRALDILQGLGVAQEDVLLVANRHVRRRSLKPSKVVKALGRDINHYLPDDCRTASTSNNVGVPLVEDAPHTPLAQAHRKLADSVLACQRPEFPPISTS